MSRAWLGLATALFGAAIVSTAAVACNSAELTGAKPGASSGDPAGVLEPDEALDGGSGGGARDPARDLDGAVLPTTSAVTLQIQPSDNGAALLSSIRAAKTSVHMTMYLLTDFGAIDALGDMKQAGRDVKVVLNQTFPSNDGSNQNAFTQLKNRGVDVVWAPPGYAYTHAKAIAIDGEKLVVMTMNLTESSASSNREIIATDTDPQDVADFETIFQADFANASSSVNGKLVLSPQSASSLDARQRLVALIDGAKTSLDVESQTISDTAVVNAILAAHASGVKTRIVYDGNFAGSPAQQEAVGKLAAAGVPLRVVKNPDIHVKTIVVDGTRAFVGSQNLTSNALFNNREVGLIVDNAAEVAKITAAIDQDFAAGAAP